MPVEGHRTCPGPRVGPEVGHRCWDRGRPWPGHEGKLGDRGPLLLTLLPPGVPQSHPWQGVCCSNPQAS